MSVAACCVCDASHADFIVPSRSAAILYSDVTALPADWSNHCSPDRSINHDPTGRWSGDPKIGVQTDAIASPNKSGTRTADLESVVGFQISTVRGGSWCGDDDEENDDGELGEGFDQLPMTGV